MWGSYKVHIRPKKSLKPCGVVNRKDGIEGGNEELRM